MPRERDVRTNTDDGPILALLDAGDVALAVDEIYRRYGAVLRGFCRRVLQRAPMLAEDAWQTTFLQVQRDLHKFSRQSPLKSWLFRIAKNRCLDALRKLKPVSGGSSGSGGDSGGGDLDLPEDGAAPGTSGDRHDPFEWLLRVEIAEILQRCLGRLPPRVQMDVYERFYLERSFAEMALDSGEPSKTVAKRVERAMKALRRCVLAQGVNRP